MLVQPRQQKECIGNKYEARSRYHAENGVGAEQLGAFMLVLESSPPNARCGTLNNVNTLRLIMVQVASQAKMAVSLDRSKSHCGGLKTKYKDSAKGSGRQLKGCLRPSCERQRSETMPTNGSLMASPIIASMMAVPIRALFKTNDLVVKNDNECVGQA